MVRTSPITTATDHPLARGSRPADYSGCPETVDAALARGKDLTATGWGVRDAVIALAGAFAFGLALAVAFGLMGRPDGGMVLIIATFVPWIAMAGWPLLATRRYGNGPVVDLGLRVRSTDLVTGPVGGVVALAAGWAVARITELILGPFDSAAGQAASRAAETSPRWQLIVFGFLVAVGAPFAEELVFRGMLWAGLARLGMRPYLTLVTTTVVFAGFHLEGSRLPVLLVVGLVLGFLRMRTRRLGASMIAHGVNNLPGAIGIALA